MFVPNKDSNIEQYNLNISKTIDLRLLNEKLLALCTNNSNKGDNILVDEQGLVGIQELQGIANYQDREFDNSNNELVKDSLYAVDNTATATNLAISRATSPTYCTVAIPNISSFSNSTKAILYPCLVGPISNTKIALGI